MPDDHQHYIPAAQHDWALPFYDPVMALIGASRVRAQLLVQAGIASGHRILEIGCGTGSLLVAALRLQPGAEAVGLDPDRKALARATRKAARAGLAIRLEHGFSEQIPFLDASFDRVLSAFMYHHLGTPAKTATLSEARRVLRPGGSLHLVDFTGPDERGGTIMRAVHADEELRENSPAQLLARMREAGFTDAHKVADGSMLFGLMRIAYYAATR